MEIRDLRVGDYFIKWDGRRCRLEVLNDSRARLFDVDDGRRSSISPGTEVLEVSKQNLNRGGGGKEKKTNNSNNSEGPKEGRDMTKKKIMERAKFVVDGVAATSVLYWMGKDGFSFGEAKATLEAKSQGGMPKDDSIRWCLTAGRTGRRPVPELTIGLQEDLRRMAKTVEKKETGAEKRTLKKTKKASKKTAADRENKGLPPIKVKKVKKAELKFSKAAQLKSNPKASAANQAAIFTQKKG